MRNLLSALLLVFLPACGSPPLSKCPKEFRAVIDMGSGATKMNMAEVEICAAEPRIVAKVDREESRPVPLEASKTKDGEIPDEARAKALGALSELREIAATEAKKRGYKHLHLAVVGTHALRRASNNVVFVHEMEQRKFAARALSQEEEGRAGRIAALRAPRPENCTSPVVWDVGGGSAQITSEARTENFNFGSEAFRAEILKFKGRPKGNCAPDPESPNPLLKRFAEARAKAFTRAPDWTLKNQCVIGIGGVHNKAVLAAIQKNWRQVGPCSCKNQPNCLPTKDGYSRAELTCLAKEFAAKSDCDPEIAGPYARTAVSNLALVLGFMDKMSIDVVHVRPVNMGDYFLTDRGLIFAKTPL